MFNLEFLEICKFILQTRIFLQVFRVKAFDWWSQFAKRICNEGAEVEQAPVHGTEKSKFLGAKIDVFHDAENSKFCLERSILST